MIDKNLNRKEAEYFIKSILGLKAIIKDSSVLKNGMVSREYITEKLNMILQGNGINLHPTIIKHVREQMIEIFGKVPIEEIDYEGI